MEKITNYFMIILIIISFSCKKNNNSNFINHKTLISNDTIKITSIDRGIITMKSLYREYLVHSWCPLVYKGTFPNWIKDNRKPIYSFNNYIFKPDISNIDYPYIIFKKENENYFYVIKNQDTLSFSIETDTSPR